VKHSLSWLISLALFAGFCWLLPPFHVVSLRQTQQSEAFSATAFAARFWETKLIPAPDRAVSVAELLAALAHDAGAARQHFGHSPGLSSTTCFFVRGSGRITEIATDGVKVSLDGATAPSEVKLSTGLVFGNTVRDATGLLNASDFPNSQDFNDISAELDHLVEARVLPGLHERAAVGKPVRFAGCLELEDGDLPKTSEIIPVEVEWP